MSSLCLSPAHQAVTSVPQGAAGQRAGAGLRAGAHKGATAARRWKSGLEVMGHRRRGVAIHSAGPAGPWAKGRADLRGYVHGSSGSDGGRRTCCVHVPLAQGPGPAFSLRVRGVLCGELAGLRMRGGEGGLRPNYGKRRESARGPFGRLALCSTATDKELLRGHFRTARAQRGHSANYYGDYPGNNPENHPTCGIMHNQFKTQKFKHLMLAMGPRDLNSAPL